MRNAIQCLAEAERCERLAALSTSNEFKKIFTRLAHRWRQLSVTEPPRPEEGGTDIIHPRFSGTHGR